MIHVLPTIEFKGNGIYGGAEILEGTCLDNDDKKKRAWEIAFRKRYNGFAEKCGDTDITEWQY